MVSLVKLVAIHTDTGGDPLTIKLTVNLVRLVPLMGITTTTGGNETQPMAIDLTTATNMYPLLSPPMVFPKSTNEALHLIRIYGTLWFFGLPMNLKIAVLTAKTD